MSSSIVLALSSTFPVSGVNPYFVIAAGEISEKRKRNYFECSMLLALTWIPNRSFRIYARCLAKITGYPLNSSSKKS